MLYSVQPAVKNLNLDAVKERDGVLVVGWALPPPTFPTRHDFGL